MKGIAGAILVLASAVFQLVSNTEENSASEVFAAILGWMTFSYGWSLVVIYTFVKEEHAVRQ